MTKQKTIDAEYSLYVRSLIFKGCADHDCGIPYMSDLIGVGTSTVYHWANGEAMPSAEGLIKLLRFAGYDVPGYKEKGGRA